MNILIVSCDWIGRNDAIPQPNHTHTHTMWKIHRARYTNASSVAEKIVH